MFASLFYMGITFGRFLNGFVADKFGDMKLSRYGIVVMIVGVVMVGTAFNTEVALVGLILICLGCAPIYPSKIHTTPSNFGKENSQAIIGIQMASAYSGIAFMPSLFGLVAGKMSIGFYPVYPAVFALLILILTESMNRTVDSNRPMGKPRP